MAQVMGKAEGFDVFLYPRTYDPLVPPELVSLQIRFHLRKPSFDLLELWMCDFCNVLPGLSPLGHDVVQVEDQSLGAIRDVSTGLKMGQGFC